MAKVRDLLVLPFIALYRLLLLEFIPAVLFGLAWLIFGVHSPVFVVTALVCGLFGLLMFNLWSRQIHGRLRSLGRGSVSLRSGRGGGSW
jgi:hypothetical protein